MSKFLYIPTDGAVDRIIIFSMHIHHTSYIQLLLCIYNNSFVFSPRHLTAYYCEIKIKCHNLNSIKILFIGNI